MSASTAARDALYAQRRQDLAPAVCALYSEGHGHKAIAGKLGLSPRICRTILIEQGVYRPGALHGGVKHREALKAAWQARTPAWQREQKRRSKKAKARRTWKLSDLPLFTPRPKPPKPSTPETRERVRAEFARRYEHNLEFRLKHVLRSRVRKVVKRADRYSEHTLDWLGCTPLDLIAHIEKQWTEGMSWENYGCRAGQWSIDHIRPCASFDMLNPQHRAECFHYTNLQPLWHIVNVRKGDTWDYQKCEADSQKRGSLGGMHPL